MGKKRLQVVLPDSIQDDFYKEAESQGRTASNLARNYIITGLSKDKKAKSDVVINGSDILIIQERAKQNRK